MSEQETLLELFEEMHRRYVFGTHQEFVDAALKLRKAILEGRKHK